MNIARTLRSAIDQWILVILSLVQLRLLGKRKLGSGASFARRKGVLRTRPPNRPRNPRTG
jgi:hypothetical protein